MGSLVVCGGCRDQPDARHATTASAPDDAADESEEVYLAPFIPKLGVPVAFHRHAWIHVEAREMWHELNVPFDADSMKSYSLELAIWKDGTIIWSQSSDRGAPEHHEGRVDSEAVQRLLAAIDAKTYRTRQNVRYSEEARLDRYIPASMIAILDGSNRLIMCSNLDQMELLKEYWHWHDGKETRYPFDQYSFEQFCAEVPESYCQHLKDFARLRGQLRSVIPKEGNRIDIEERIRWVLLALPKAE